MPKVCLWEHLHQDFSDRLIVITGVDDLRLSEVQISRELSWERTAQDVFWELIHNPCVNSLSHCAHVIISFGPAGAILLSRQEEKGLLPFKCSLFFDPKLIEQMWEKDNPGGMVGMNTCLAAGLVRQWMLSPEKPDLPLGIQSGLAAMRTLHLEGYGELGTASLQLNLVFPVKKIAASLIQSANQFAVAQVQDPMRFILKQGGHIRETTDRRVLDHPAGRIQRWVGTGRQAGSPGRTGRGLTWGFPGDSSATC